MERKTRAREAKKPGPSMISSFKELATEADTYIPSQKEKESLQQGRESVGEEEMESGGLDLEKPASLSSFSHAGPWLSLWCPRASSVFHQPLQSGANSVSV